VGALSGVGVVEVGGGIAVGYATKLLADLGADVVTIEPPAGDAMRHEHPELYAYLHEGKRSVVAAHPGALVDGADVAVTSIELAGARVVVLVTPFGRDGPYGDVPVSDLTLQAMAGWVSSHGVPALDPVQVGGRLHEYVAGSYAACAALTALRAAEDLGRPVTVDLSVLECLVGTLAYPMLFHQSLSALGLPAPESRYSVLPGIVRCRDGWVGINALTGQHWQDICALMEADEFAGRQRDLAFGGAPLERFFSGIAPWLAQRAAEEVVEQCQLLRIPAAPVANGESLPRLAQFRQRPFFRSGPPVRPGPPYRLSATPAGPGGPAPALGEHTAQMRLAPRPTTAAVFPGDHAYLPFAGLFVIDLGTFWAGPYIGLYLGAMGADVIKVEAVQRPDGFRFSGAFPEEGEDWYERSGLWQATNLNKRGITLDLTRPEGIEVMRRLIARADVLIENFSPRVLEQFELGYDRVRQLRRDIVMVRLPGYGLEGPWRDYVGWAMSFEQASGMAQVTGDGSRPLNPGGFLDPVVGMHGALAVQAALAHRRRTGEGQLLEIAQVEVGACLTAEQVIEFSLSGQVLRGQGNRDQRWAPQGVYRCAPDRRAGGRLDGEWVALSVRDEDEWVAFVEVLGRPRWATDPSLASLAGRRSAHDALDAGIAGWTRRRTPGEVVGLLRPRGIPAATLLTAPIMYDEAQLNARGYYQPLHHPVTGTRRYPGWPMQFSFGPPTPHRRVAPTLGQHNGEVLSGLLRLDRATLERLEAAGIIGDRLRSGG
jgi:crotonobetainyl-CoA:carnitine CoA-transferase CaiB-like acyl-CoA transferase